ncbi:hypothetical protein KGY79_10865 [Candidatus Bipolaricaulota bacterium]|nr:hypothetical protein [Candidatus Bipolaricaulota bacterium]
MGISDWFSFGEETTKEEAKDSIVRFLCKLEKDYRNMDDFLEDFYGVINEAIEKYNKNNPVKADKLDRDQAYKAGGRWIYEADIEKLDKEGEVLEEAKDGFISRKSTFKVIAREQPDFEIELSGTESLIDPFLEEMESVLEENGLDHKVVTVARPGLGKATQTESEPSAQA